VSLRVISFTVSSSTSDRLGWTDDDYNGLFITKALKRKSFGGRCTVRIGGQEVGVRSGERELALKWFAHVAHQYLFDAKAQTPIALIPIPNAGAIDIKASCDTVEQAASLANSLGNDGFVMDIVRWADPVTTNQGPPQNAKFYYDRALVYPGADPARKTTVLVDEVFNTGAHIEGVAQRLRQNGVHVDFALVAAHVPRGPSPTPVFKAHEHTLQG
jgi:hypothetical protein